ncbi:MAG: tRNA uridine-5-carboxymethylaminomethyl(34) synthesis GTPase MnmE [Bacteroidales bacterium]|nr:tRNA uridine-5-carboxymethylaminomethyl(34) synthesis GTPase MnmE [Bacteroidales bacterium]
MNKNICALATPQGSGAIGVIRLSGPDVISIVDKIFVPGGKSKASLADTPAYKMRFGSIYDGERLLDEVLVSVFHAPHSYTGENSVEISCHGSSYILQQVMLLLLKCGIKMAEPGEFSKRAFLNGKLDLAQAEAVADLIASETAAAHQVAMKQMKGGFSNELRQMRDSLLNLVSMMELELDFSEEDVEFADRSELKNLLDQVTSKVGSLIESFTLGNVIKNGVPVAIIGATNTGKSTLLNTLLGEDKAIVSNIHGTTRDVIEDTINLGGITFRFIDTAGIRETKETIEIIGIERTYQKLKQASIVVMVLDATRPEYFESSLINLSTRLNKDKQKLVILLNKAELAGSLNHSGTEPERGQIGKDGTEEINNNLSEGQKICANILSSAILNIDSNNESFNSRVSDLEENSLNNDSLESNSVNKLIDHIKNICSNSAENLETPLLSPISVLPISAKQKLGITSLKELLISTQKDNSNIDSNATLVTNARHYQALMEAQIALYRVEDGLASATPTDLVAQDIREALYHLGSIVGEINTEEILGNIFSRFCIGK